MESLLNPELKNVSTQEAETNQNNLTIGSKAPVSKTGWGDLFPGSGENFSSSRTDDSRSGCERSLLRPNRRRGIRYSKQVLSILNEWFFKHSSNPYPNPTEKTQLVVLTGLDKKQVTVWFANARRSQRNRHKKSHPQGNPCNEECRFLVQFPFLNDSNQGSTTFRANILQQAQFSGNQTG